jgi:hypothetical protein
MVGESTTAALGTPHASSVIKLPAPRPKLSITASPASADGSTVTPIVVVNDTMALAKVSILLRRTPVDRFVLDAVVVMMSAYVSI